MRVRILALLSSLFLIAGAAAGQVPTPAAHFGFEIGADRKLANWDQLTAYYERLARNSERVVVDTLGPTTEGQPFIMLTITSPENQARIDELHDIQMKLSDPRTISGEAELERLLNAGRSVVLITHGIHATEVGGPQTAARLAYELASSDDPEILNILDNVILLQIPSLNPDGTQWVVDWYNQWVGSEFEAAPLPWLYHSYVGHDNNRDWYAFTQVETRHTVLEAHNAWHPHIVHDIHQMGGSGARIFFPPYIDPWERNIDPALTSAVSMLGTYMAAELTAQGKEGVVVNAIYDAFTPARAYQHYHGGARILSETASARIATPVNVSAGEISGRRGYDAAQSSWNFPNPWGGGEWGLPDIVDYMDAGALALLTNAANNRRYWLENFYGINKRAVDKWDRWPEAWVIPADQANRKGLQTVLRILTTADVEVHRAEAAFQVGGSEYPAGSYVVPMRQPYASFAQTMLEVQEYPDLREYPGGPPRAPYDVTAHTLPLLMNVEAFPVEDALTVSLSDPIAIPDVDYVAPPALRGAGAPRVGLYKSWDEPMPEGWTRWVFDQHEIRYDTLHDADVRAGDLAAGYDVILFQSQEADEITEGLSAGEVPADYAGGLGSEGVRAIQEFVRGGGRLVAIESATDFAIDAFGLGVDNMVERLPSQDFFIPGSILSLKVDGGHPMARGMEEETIAWFWRSSRAFSVTDTSIRVIARYGNGNPLLSGWLLGPEHIAGQAAILEASVGQGTVVLFGFQPDYRAQTIATWPLLFNSLVSARLGADQ